MRVTISLLFFNFYSEENEQEAQLQPPGAGVGCAVALVRVVGMLAARRMRLDWTSHLE